jgi:hypothetical protein
MQMTSYKITTDVNATNDRATQSEEDEPPSDAQQKKPGMSKGGANSPRDRADKRISMNEPLHETTSNAKQGGNTERRESGIPDELQQANANNTGNKKHPEPKTMVRMSWIFAYMEKILTKL